MSNDGGWFLLLCTEICQRLLYRSAGTRLASLNFVCRRFWHTTSSRSRSEHVEVHTGTGNWEHLWRGSISAHATSSSTTTPITTTTQLQTEYRATNSRSLSLSLLSRVMLLIGSCPTAVMPGGRSCRMITEMFSPLYSFFFSKEEGTDGKRGVFDFIEKEIFANA